MPASSLVSPRNPLARRDHIPDRARCLETYSKHDVLTYYCSYVALQKPEAAILGLIHPRLQEFRMLEIGVGGGRLSEYFAPRVLAYHGIDLCPAMVQACRERFAGRLPENAFSVGDMRELDSYAPGSLELVLISYNTIDHLNHAEREQFLRQMRRITAPGGYFCFSTHNIASLGRWMALESIEWKHPLAALRKLRDGARRFALNLGALRRHPGADHVVIYNGTHGDFALQIYYVRTSAQLHALQRLGFDEVRIFSLETGLELKTGEEIAAATDRWLYYLCR